MVRELALGDDGEHAAADRKVAVLADAAAEERALRLGVVHVTKEVVHEQQPPRQHARRRYREAAAPPPVAAPHTRDQPIDARHLGLLGAVVGHVDADALLEAFAQRRLDPRARADDVLAAGPHLEDGLGGRDAEVLEERGRLGLGHQEPVAHPVARVDLDEHAPPLVVELERVEHLVADAGLAVARVGVGAAAPAHSQAPLGVVLADGLVVEPAQLAVIVQRTAILLADEARKQQRGL
mmetsp:Transcript_50846/g.163452  ORF Transcript_50846/g.163452 Transcript_50846/m.163452 type:complete len:238 (+) Transcript_50846:411-1124(+)